MSLKIALTSTSILPQKPVYHTTTTVTSVFLDDMFFFFDESDCNTRI
jgi:hypothetical protein